MKNKIYKPKILVLSDLKKSANNTLKSTISLAKMVHGDIEFFYVKKASEVVENENPLSANRAINQEYNQTIKKIRNLINPISKQHNISINYKYSFGNVKNEIEKFIVENKPDIIVLGKRKSKSLNLIGDNITDFILKKHSGIVMIADYENSLEPDKHFSLGVLNGLETSYSMGFVQNIIEHTHEPIKSFKILKNSNSDNDIFIPNNKKTVEYKFNYNDNTVKSFSNYLSLNNINLLYLDRGLEKTEQNENLLSYDINEIIKNTNVSLLFKGEQQFIFSQ